MSQTKAEGQVRKKKTSLRTRRLLIFSRKGEKKSTAKPNPGRGTTNFAMSNVNGCRNGEKGEGSAGMYSKETNTKLRESEER